jgi:hypothetical protein
VAQHNLPMDVRDGDAVPTIPVGLSVFRIGDDASSPSSASTTSTNPMSADRLGDQPEVVRHECEACWCRTPSCARASKVFVVVTTVSQMAEKSTRPIWMLEKLNSARMGGAAASADRAPPSADCQMVSFLRHEASS